MGGRGGPFVVGFGRGCDVLFAASRLLDAEGVLTIAGSFMPAVTDGLASEGDMSLVRWLEEAPVAKVEGLDVGKMRGYYYVECRAADLS